MTELAAWWGAIVATLVLVWEIYKWKSSGSKVAMELQHQDKAVVGIKAVNYGKQASTISSIGIRYYPGFWDILRNKCAKEGVIAKPSITHPLPYQLEPDDSWFGLIEQDDDMRRMAMHGYLMCDLYLTDRAKPIRRRIRISNAHREQSKADK
ncbi:MAG: hypothetical protein ACE5F3_00895 [Mariprofundaceae bacterium]